MNIGISKIILSMIIGFFIVVLSINFIIATHIPVQCNDGEDNDLDGLIDFPEDNGCEDEFDRTEAIKFGYAHGCLGDGDRLLDVFDNVNYRCEHTFCDVCVLMTEAGNWTTKSSRCNGLPRCEFGGSSNGPGGPGDVSPPVLTLETPVQDEIYTSRAIPFVFELNEVSSVFSMDLLDRRPRWRRVCSNCIDYDRTRRFDEGLNTINIRATDRRGNEAFTELSFFIDSKEPKIKRTYPRRGDFANEDFSVEFQELNPETLTLFYGITGDMRESNVDIDTECVLDRKTYECETSVSDIGDFDGEEIEYWFELKDIAMNVDEAKHTFNLVDVKDPEINNNVQDDLLIDDRRVTFYLDITEDNFDEVIYLDEDASRPRWKRLCSRLDDFGICEKRKTFRSGHHDVSLQVIDEAGNSIGTAVSFDIL